MRNVTQVKWKLSQSFDSGPAGGKARINNSYSSSLELEAAYHILSKCRNPSVAINMVMKIRKL
jgi:hypothetical protein